MSVSVKDYPLVACLHPRIIHSNGQRMVVGCGHCHACLSAKAQRNSLRLQLEQNKYSFSVFLTLSYNEESVPRYEVVPETEYFQKLTPSGSFMSVCKRTIYNFIPMNKRFDGILDSNFMVDEDGTVDKALNEYFQKQKDYDALGICKSPSFDGTVRFASVRDIQLFMKRLRFNIKKLFNEKIRYYVVSEYGPKSLRPHFHLLLFTNSLEVANLLKGDKFYKKVGNRKLYESTYLSDTVWKLGCVTSERADNKAFGYLASYVNSSACLPFILKQDWTKPFSSHSNALGEKLVCADAKEVFEMDDSEICREVAVSGTSQFVFNRWSSYINKFFPKIVGYSKCSHDFRRYVYSLYDKLQGFSRKVVGSESSVVELTNILVGTALQFRPVDCSFDELLYLENMYKELVDFFPSSEFSSRSRSPLRYDSLWRKVYSVLLVGKKVSHLASICGVSLDSYVSRIERFYNSLDYQRLSSTLFKLQNGDFNPYVYYTSCECNSFGWLDSTDEYKFLLGASHVNFFASIKHKEVKDVFSFFNS